jgi:putative two-component system response regulator
MPTHPKEPSLILVVDDTPDNLELMSGLLSERYQVRVANHGERALKMAQSGLGIDLILLDIMMPGIDGYEVCRQLKKNPSTCDIPVIFLSARSQDDDERIGLALGAVDYITKPINPAIVLARIQTHLALKEAADFLKDKNAYLETEIRRRMDEVSMVQDVAIMAMASLAETRDNETGNHIRRTQKYVEQLAMELRQMGLHLDTLSTEYVQILYKSAPLHDIGKVGIPDSILLKAGPLTKEEFEVMKRHTTIGHDAIIAAERLLQTPNSFLQCAREIAYSHQEKWDGSGYPQGLKGDQIPLSARLMAVADVYDALISRRVYKPAMSHEQAAAMIVRGGGSHFDPQVVEAFSRCEAQFRQIAERYTDDEGSDAAHGALGMGVDMDVRSVRGCEPAQ